jgi:hypothetical protein
MKKPDKKILKSLDKALSNPSETKDLTPEQQKVREAYMQITSGLGSAKDAGMTLDEVIDIVTDFWQELEQAEKKMTD